jgi:hypothetical protein
MRAAGAPVSAGLREVEAATGKLKSDCPSQCNGKAGDQCGRPHRGSPLCHGGNILPVLIARPCSRRCCSGIILQTAIRS